ncbi:UTRA domain-containing protein [Nonomuraea sp. NPDC050691]|uniref:UTRA domain-containing protein n=1 Tax=Nonomuraea sp. NPDC050691 TaxID=3155661 RepID=UPI0033E3F1E7
MGRRAPRALTRRAGSQAREHLLRGRPPRPDREHLHPLEHRRGTPLEEEVPGPGGIYAAFEEQGHRLTRMLEEVQARMPRNGEVERLNAEPGTPVLDVLHVSYDQDETPQWT